MRPWVRCRLLVPVDEIRFSQEYILPHLDDSRPLTEIVHKVRSGCLTSSDFPDIMVRLYNKLFFTHSNRWLWIFREARVEKVAVKLLHLRKTDRSGRKLMNFEYTDNYLRFSDPLYFPVIQKLQQDPTTGTAPKSPVREEEELQKPTVAPSTSAAGAEEVPTTARESIQYSRKTDGYTDNHLKCSDRVKSPVIQNLQQARTTTAPKSPVREVEAPSTLAATEVPTTTVQNLQQVRSIAPKSPVKVEQKARRRSWNRILKSAKMS